VQVPVYNLSREVVKNIDISDYVFAVPENVGLVHQAVVRQKANARQGTADTKTRSEVAGSSKKLHRQKHTGMARAGTRRSPTRRGGGIIFGPHPRDYRQDMPKKMRQLALRCVLSAKAGSGELMILEQLALDEVRTKRMSGIIKTLEIDSPVLIVTEDVNKNVVMSARNIRGTKTLPASLLNVVDLLSFKMLLMTEAAVRKAEQLWGKKSSEEENSESV